ncbi:hypothetical protein [Phenylobacterium sp.]|uniref:hypothetical protein n=1 Tax=Phenylobacterium sp. TaxID=1871053 RepID=UPI002FE40BD0
MGGDLRTWLRTYHEDMVREAKRTNVSWTHRRVRRRALPLLFAVPFLGLVGSAFDVPRPWLAVGLLVILALVVAVVVHATHTFLRHGNKPYRLEALDVDDR